MSFVGLAHPSPELPRKQAALVELVDDASRALVECVGRFVPDTVLILRLGVAISRANGKLASAMNVAAMLSVAAAIAAVDAGVPLESLIETTRETYEHALRDNIARVGS